MKEHNNFNKKKIISENLSLIYQIVLEKFSSKKSKFAKNK